MNFEKLSRLGIDIFEICPVSLTEMLIEFLRAIGEPLSTKCTSGGEQGAGCLIRNQDTPAALQHHVQNLNTSLGGLEEFDVNRLQSGCWHG